MGWSEEVKGVVSKPFRPTLTLLVAVVALAGVFIAGENALQSKIDDRAKAVWADYAIRTTETQKQQASALENHEKRLHVLEQQGGEVLRKLETINVQIGFVREDLNDLKKRGK